MTVALSYTISSARVTFRNARFVLFTLALPLILYLLFNSLYGKQDSGTGLSVSAYLMVSMASYGALGAAINSGARIALERQAGWNRQLRLTALSGRGYMVSRSIVAMLVALPAIILVFLAGVLVGKVSLPFATWLEVGVAVWLALIPFAVIGLVIGFVASVDSVQPLTVLVYLAMSILGGLWFPVDQLPSALQHVAKALPSYWVAEIGRDVLGGNGVPLQGVAVLAGWTVAMALIGVWGYQRSGRRS
jgi:ABC-2 type transport system permease protein